MPTPQLKSQSWLRRLLMLSRWRRRTHHPHRYVRWTQIATEREEQRKELQTRLGAREARTRRNYRLDA
eukprot:5555245-Pleurochrysis_carterae.AAC.1